MYHSGLVYTPIPIPKAMKIPAAKAAGDKEWDKLKTLSAWSESKVLAKSHEAQNKKTQEHVATLMDLFHLKHSDGKSCAKVQRTSRVSRRQCERRRRTQGRWAHRETFPNAQDQKRNWR